MSEDRGCCDKCAKLFIMIINVVIIIIGGAILGLGLYWQLSDTGFYKEIFNHDIFNVPIISMVVGGFLILVGFCGFFGSCCEVVFLLKAYMGFLILIMLLEIILAVGCVAKKSTVEEAAEKRTLELMAFYADDTKDEAGIITKTLDLIQENFDCCGVITPAEWSENRPALFLAGSTKYVPDSCCKASVTEKTGCGKTADYAVNANINTNGCKASIINFVESNLLYVGIMAGIVVLLQMVVILVGCSYLTELSDKEFECYDPLPEEA